MLPNHERYRSSPLPSRPFSLDPRDMTSRDIDIALQHVHQGVQGRRHDYFGSETARYAGEPTSPPRMSYATTTTSWFEDTGRDGHQSRGRHVDEVVRRTNLAVSLANHNINPRSQFTQIHPMMCSDGKFPADFRSPRTIESVKLLDTDTQLDRILQSYRLPYDSRSVLASFGLDVRMSRDPVATPRLQQAKLQILFEHLGATRIVEQEKMDHGLI